MLADHHIRKAAKIRITSKGKIAKRREWETAEQAAVIAWADRTYHDGLLIGHYLTHVPNEAKRGPKARADFIKLGGRSGYPDLILDIPVYCVSRNIRYSGLRIEMKPTTDIKSVVSKSQQMWLKRLNTIGYKAVICYGSEHAISTITDYLNIGIAEPNQDENCRSLSAST